MAFVRAELCRFSCLVACAAAVGFLAPGCGGKTSDAGAIEDAGGDAPITTDAPVGTDTGIDADVGFACPSEPVTREVVASTPRADAELEQLALLLGTSIVADGATYARVVRDVGAIRVKMPALADIKVRAPYGQRMRIVADRATAEAMRAGKAPELACHDAFWGGLEGTYTFSTDGKSGGTELTFKGLYAIDRLACIYLRVPGVFQVQAGFSFVGDGPVLFGWIEGDTYHYAFDQAGGDCPAGCTTHHVWHFSTTADGTVTLVEELPDGSPRPSWWSHREPSLDKCLTR